ncbi:MAG: arylsulfatase [Pirellulales bacterium]
MKQIPALLAVLYAAISLADAGAADRPPNIVFILADDLGLGDLDCYGGDAIPTPNIDRLAAEGLRFTNAYSASAVCAPTRCGLMTGLHMGHATRRANGSRNGEIPLAPEQVTVAELLKGAGYATGGFGKWGLGNVGTTGVPEKQGFDIFYGYYDQTHAHNYFPAFLVRNSVNVPMLSGLPGKQGKGDAYSPDLITDETLKFIEANKDRPFFCYAAWTLPHGQHEIPDASAFANRLWPQPVKNHAAMIARLDADVGRVVEKLRQLGLAENTLVFFTSDNGADGPGRTVFNGTAGLRGFKRHLYEGGIRAPFIARWPGKVAAGLTSDLLTSHVDFLATACELAGVAAPAGTDGISIVSTLLGGEHSTRHDWLYWEIYEGPYPFQQAVRMNYWKGYRTALQGTLELYDLRSDPKEQSNIVANHPDVVAQIEGIMTEQHIRNRNWKPTEKPSDEKKKKAKRVAAR